jgi:hypothetical protein
MSGLAALAVKEAAVASGLGTTFLPGVAPSAVDGFAVGTLLSGLCFLLVMAPRRRSHRKRRLARNAEQAVAPQNPVSPNLAGDVAAPAYVPAPACAPASAYVAAPACATAGAACDPFADESAEVVVSYPIQEVSLGLPDVNNAGHSKHRLAGPEAERRPEIRRGAGRHAAPPAGVGSRTASRHASR